MPKKYDFTNKTVGNLMVIGLHGKDKLGNFTWNCICKCGKQIVATSHMLNAKKITDCGCCKKNKANEYRIVGEVAYVKMITSEKVMICDAKEWESLKNFHWNASKKDGYAMASIEGKTVLYHHLILKAKDGYVRDHINRNRLDNRKCNLRYATLRANVLNKGIPKNSTSGCCGVTFEKRLGKWRAYIYCKSKMLHIGYFDNQEDAINARRVAEEEYYKPIIEKETHT